LLLTQSGLFLTALVVPNFAHLLEFVLDVVVVLVQLVLLQLLNEGFGQGLTATVFSRATTK
jgi:hypothetical protein